MKFGLSWWGKNWLDALQGVDLTNRIPRGKSYANTGKVYDIEIDKNIVTAKVTGKSYNYYDVTIAFRTFTNEQINIILETVKNNEYILSSLLNHKLPEQLHEALYEKGIQVFPTSIEYIDPECDCPDYAYICKHIAGVIYMISHEVDKDPFQVFKLQGCDLLELLNYKPTSNNIKNIDELFVHKDNTNNESHDIDFSDINDLKENIFLLLNDSPLFYEKDFKSILSNIYGSLERYVKKFVDKYDRNENKGYMPYMQFSGHEKVSLAKDVDDIEEWLDNTFLEQWNYPNKWETFTMDINEKYGINNITTGYKSLLTEYHSEELLFTFLTELDQIEHKNWNKHLELLRTVYQFSMELIKKHALIPEFFESNNDYHIRWIPAFFDKNINQIIGNLAYTCPDDLLTLNNKRLSKIDQIITLVSFIVKGSFHKYKRFAISQSMKKLLDNSVVKLFLGEASSFSKFEEQGYENLINQWLSKFVLSSREYELFLVINEEDDGIFKVDVEVNINDTEMKNILEVIETTNNDEIKLQLLSDVYVINEVFPEVNNILNYHEINFDLEEFSEFFMNTLPLFEMLGINIILPKNLRKIFRPKLSLDIASSKNEKSYLTFNDIVKFDWKVVLGDINCSIEEFNELVKNSRGLVRIANEYVILDENETKSLIKQIEKLPQKLNKNELLKAVLSKQIDYADVEVDENIEEMLSNIKKSSETKVPDNLNAQLRPYQKVGYSWLVQNIKTGFGSILADDMGLGKTLQVLSTGLYLKNEGLINKAKILIIAPTSLLTNWQQEINRFTPTLSSYIYHGNSRKFPEEEYDIYLTSYGVIRRDVEKFNEKKWFLTVVDEAQNIKNPATQQTLAVKSIKSRNKIALSGTPVENRLSEYWSIFDYINKGYLTSLKKFRQNYIVPIEKEHNQNVLDNFKLITQPFILRRLKSDKNIINDLPDKITNDVYCSLTKNQAALYKETLDTIMLELDSSEGFERKGIVLKLINSLKQICNHPSQYTKSKKYDINESGKMEVLINILENIIEANEKVLIFTQYVEMGNIMKELIEEKLNEEVLFLHGSLSRKQRDTLVDRFQNNTQTRIFIISLKAGGTGLNLTAATNIIHYDLWWNPAVENQATDRAYRIGQKDNVMVYRFITNGTFEEKINEMINDKKELAELTVGSGEKFITEMNDAELIEMLTLRKSE